jgi:guanine deaminase
VPGYVNGHQHSHELLHRGRSEKIPLEEWMTSVRPARSLPLTERDIYTRTLAVAAEALRSGTTTICDDVGIDPFRQPEHLRAVANAYQDAGIRAFVGPTLFDVPFARAVPFAIEELPQAAVALFEEAATAAPQRAALLAAFVAFAKKWAGRRVQAIAAPSAPQRCSPDLLRAIRALGDSLELPVIMHLLETRVQAVGAAISKEGGWVAELDRLGFLKPKTSLIHGVWLSALDVDLIARSGTSVQHNPLSNLKLGSGVAHVRKLLDAGVNVSLGSDGCGSIETLSLQPNVAAAALLSTLRGEPESWLSAAEAFRAATIGGAVALGIEHEIGSIAPGYRADLVLYRLDRPPLTPLNDPLRQLVFGDAGAAVASVIVDGRLVFHDGRLLTIDEDRLDAELQEMHARMMPFVVEAERAAAALAPAMRRIRHRNGRQPLPGVPAARLDQEPNP